MVVKLTGTVEGQEIVFSRIRGDMWRATVPSVKSGAYVLELTAIDEAGNIGYTTKYIITIDTTALKVTLEPFPYSTDVRLSDYYCVLM